jgi:hypothetical protein
MSMATKHELEQRVSELEESLEQARDLIDQALGIEGVDETDEDAAE